MSLGKVGQMLTSAQQWNMNQIRWEVPRHSTICATLLVHAWPIEQPLRWLGMRLADRMLLIERLLSSGYCLVIKCLWTGITQSWPFCFPGKNYIQFYCLKSAYEAWGSGHPSLLSFWVIPELGCKSDICK